MKPNLKFTVRMHSAVISFKHPMKSSQVSESVN